MAPKNGGVVLCAAGAMGLMAAPSLFVQPMAGARPGAAASRATQQAEPLAQKAHGQVPLAGIVGPSVVGAIAVGAAVASLSSSSSSRKRSIMKAEGAAPALAAEDALPPPPVWDVTKEMGVGPAPIGFFDPLGFTKDKDEQEFRKLRCAELKHGRVAMMASVGAVFQHFVRFPGFENVNGTFGAINKPAGTFGCFCLFAACSILELAWRERPDSKWAGDYGDPFGIKMYDDEMRNKEVNNGRMAMISCLGIWLAEVVSGKDAIQQFGL